MKARSPSRSGSGTDRAGRRAAALLPLILLLTSVPVAAEEAKAAVWRVMELGFTYRSSIAMYSCGQLERRVAAILLAIGARDDIDVKATGCESVVFPLEDESQRAFGTPSDRLFNQRIDRGQLADVRVRLMMPAEVTPEVLAEIARDKSRRELVSRVTGNPAAGLDDPVVFAAQRQSVTLSHASIGLGREECELLDQMSSSIFRQLGVRVVRRSYSCDRDRISRFYPKLTVESLMGVPLGAGNLPQLPPLGESETEPSAPAPADAEPAEPGESATAPPE